jgi:hypothetical protein
VLFHFLFLLLQSILKSNACCSFWAELLAEVESLRDAADVLADFIRALAGRWEERLLNARALIRAAIECGVRRGVVVALIMAQAATDVELHDVEGFPMGEGLGDYEDLLEGFEPAANVVVALVPADQVLNEDP